MKKQSRYQEHHRMLSRLLIGFDVQCKHVQEQETFDAADFE